MMRYQISRTTCPSSTLIKVFVTGLFDLNKDLQLFKDHLRDFLIQLKVSKLQLVYVCGLQCSVQYVEWVAVL